ncbi:MAG: hypothetical protein ACLVDY_01380 [Collinsella sp.]
MAWRQHAAIQSRGQHFPVDKTIGTPPAQLVGLGVHHVVRDLLGEAPEQLLHIDGAVVETGLGEHVWRRV